MKKTALYLVALVALVGLLGLATAFFGGSKPFVRATTSCMIGHDSCFSGWAWSSNIGWISFSSNNAQGGDGSHPYEVYMDPSGNLGGYAWSSNVGWISFNPTDLTAAQACQTPAGVAATPAKVDLNTGAVSGWIRVVSGIGRTDGWDGCVELAGTNHLTASLSGTATSSAGVSYNKTTGILSGFAWGDVNLGWIQFSPTVPSGGGPICKSGTDCFTGGGLTGICTATYNGNPFSGGNIQSGGTVQFSVTASGGTGPYYYNGQTTPTAGAYTTSKTYSTSGTFPNIFSFKDSSSSQLNGSASCPSVTVPEPAPLACSLPSNATWCEPSVITGPQQGVKTCPATAADVCQFYCKSGFKLNTAKTACVNSSIEEI